MFFFFSKILNYPLTPAGLLVTIALLAFLTKKSVRRRRLIGIGLGAFWLFGNSALVNELALRWEYPIRHKTPAPVLTDSTATVAVVLTGGIINTLKDVPPGRFLLGREADRAGQALYLYKTGAVRKILISGGSGDPPFGRKKGNDEGQMTARFLRMAGVRAGDVLLESQSRNTHENARFSARMLRDRFGTSRCVLVTSAAHMRRALACFRKENVQAVPYPSGFLGSHRVMEPGDYVLPREQAFVDSFYLIKESVGYVVYWAMGYL